MRLKKKKKKKFHPEKLRSVIITFWRKIPGLHMKELNEKKH